MPRDEVQPRIEREFLQHRQRLPESKERRDETEAGDVAQRMKHEAGRRLHVLQPGGVGRGRILNGLLHRRPADADALGCAGGSAGEQFQCDIRIELGRRRRRHGRQRTHPVGRAEMLAHQ